MIIAYNSNCYLLYRFTKAYNVNSPVLPINVTSFQMEKRLKPENLMCLLVHTSVLERQPHSLSETKKTKSLPCSCWNLV